VRPGDHLLFSANLAPGADYAAGMQRILPLYDNELTDDWLKTFLLDLGMEREDGVMDWVVERSPTGEDLCRVAAYFRFARTRVLHVMDERFEFRTGERMRLFFSYRYTPDRVRTLLARHGLNVAEEWVTTSGEEGIFLVRPMASVLGTKSSLPPSG